MHTTFRRAWAALALVGCGIMPAAAMAQPPARRWQVELVGGVSIFDLAASGQTTLPAPGPALPTSSPTNPSRRVPTWFLGDGASLLNGTNAEFGVAARLVPLDGALAQLGLSGANAPVGGLRVRRLLSSRWSLEGSAELHAGSTEIDQALLDAAEIARAGFVSAFTGLFGTGPFRNARASATLTTEGASSRELALTAAVRFTPRSGRTSPYLTVGGGFLTRVGDLPRIVLAGEYSFSVTGNQGAVPFAESDTLTLRYAQRNGVVGLAGLGLESRVSDRLGVTLDGRVLVGPQTLTLRMDSRPTVTTGTPAGVIESFTTPALQFSNNSSTGRASTLSGQPLNGFETFNTSGAQVRYVVTAGVSFRF